MKFNTAVDSLQQGVLICDEKSRIIYFNDAYSRFLGQTLEEARGHRIHTFRNQSVVPDVLQTGKAVEGLLRKENGIEYHASVYPIFDGEAVTGTISIVTSIEQHHQDVNKKNKTLAERVAEFERKEIELTVQAYGGGTEGKRKAAKELGISLATLYNKLNK